MPATIESLGIDRLTIDERLDLVQAIWDTIGPGVANTPLSEEMQREVDRRLMAHRANPSAAVPWEQVEAAALARIGQ
jgi:putative addiction module component (TIGR02574 family)